MENKRMKFLISRDAMNPFAANYAVRIGARINESVPWAVAQDIKFFVPPEGAESSPCLYATREDLQGLMDELWHAGIRPSEGEGSSGQLAATRAHLEDMRRLVFTEEQRRS